MLATLNGFAKHGVGFACQAGCPGRKQPSSIFLRAMLFHAMTCHSMPCHAVPQVYAAAQAMLGNSDPPVRRAGVFLSAALYAAEGDAAKADLGMKDMEHEIKSEVRS